MSKLSEALYPYQREDLEFMLEHPRCINGNECGLGKTIEALALCERLTPRHVLIVSPKTLLFEWFSQVGDWLGEDCLTPHNNGDKLDGLDLAGPKFVAVNYDLLAVPKYWCQLSSVKWDVIIFDECHRMKNPKAKRTRAALLLRAPRIIMMSGTPMQNGPQDLFPLMHIANSRLYHSYSSWVKMFCVVVPMVVGDRHFSQIVGAKNTEELNELLHRHMCRHTKHEVLKELPDKLYRTIPIELGSERKQYDQMEQELFALLDSGELVTAPAVIAQLTRLRQITLDPNLLSHEAPKPSTPSNKTATLLELVEDTEDKVVVYSYFAQYIGILKQELDKRNIKSAVVTGEVNTTCRGRAVHEFQNDLTVKVFLATIGAAGEGITLTASHTVVFSDLWFNPSVNVQAEDRLHRIGQKDSVLVIDLYCKGTVEDAVHKVVRRKEKMFNEIVGMKQSVEELRRMQCNQ
jgi:SNF2 family DNA or RNA helicase